MVKRVEKKEMEKKPVWFIKVDEKELAKYSTMKFSLFVKSIFYNELDKLKREGKLEE